MITAIAIDDEPPALQVITSFSNRIEFLQLQKTFVKTSEALRYLESFPVDLLFLDIQMPAITGIEFYRSLPNDQMVIFATAYGEYAVEGFNLSAVDYLLKPFTFERFLQAVGKAKDLIVLRQKNELEDQHLALRVDYSLVKVSLSEILYVEGLDDYVKIHLKDQQPLVVRMTMKSIIEKLPENNFIRVHRSFIIPFDKIQSVRNKSILVEGHEIPLGRSFEDAFYKKFRV